MPDITDLRISAGRWGMVAKRLIEYRDYLRLLAGEEAGTRDAPEHKACYGRAARSLGPCIAEAVQSQKSLTNKIDEQTQKMPDIVALTDAEMYELGMAVALDPTLGDMSRQGRPLTNIEGMACRFYHLKEAYKRIERDGCCGSCPDAEGYCPEVAGKCRRAEQADSCTRFVRSYLRWLEEINEEAALAAVAARLGDGCPLASEVCNV